MSTRRLAEEFHPKVWGSTQLEPWYRNATEKIGEVWFTGDPKPPLLIKLLFTTEPLSVQVHPSGPAPVGKTEMWHILRADPGAAVALGFHEEVSEDCLRKASRTGEVEKLLKWFPVRPGDTIFVPAGTVHAIGRGLVLCEVQQYSDITYRLYDYGRARELHLEEGIPVSNRGPHPGPIRNVAPGDPLVECEYFVTRRLQLSGQHRVDDGILIWLEGTGSIGGNPCQAGQAWELSSPSTVEGRAEVLHTRVP